jgi:hypothetical protein
MGFFHGFFEYEILCSTLFHLPSLRFHCAGECWDRTQDCCDFGTHSSQTLGQISSTQGTVNLNDCRHKCLVHEVNKTDNSIIVDYDAAVANPETEFRNIIDVKIRRALHIG